MKKMILLLFLLLESIVGIQAQGFTWYVKPNGDKTENAGTREYPGELQAVINKANDGDILLLTAGEYVPYNVINNGTWHDKDNNSAFLIRKNITIKGGYNDDFTKVGASDATILSGENTRFHVVVITKTKDEEVVSPTIENLTIQKGYCNATIVDPTIDINLWHRCKALNIDKNFGGGLYVVSANPRIKNVIIKKNEARKSGGGIYVENGSPIFTNVLIHNNTAAQEGGGAYCSGNNEDPTFINTTITNNTAKQDGGGIFCTNIEPSTFVKVNKVKPVFSNTIISGNIGKTKEINTTENATIKNSFVKDVVSSFSNIDKNADIKLNDDFELEASSPLIDKGNQKLNLTEFDLSSKKRVSGNGIDLGAFEYQDVNKITFKTVKGKNYTDFVDIITQNTIFQGVYDIEKNQDFDFTIKLKDVYSQEKLDVSIDKSTRNGVLTQNPKVPAEYTITKIKGNIIINLFPSDDVWDINKYSITKTAITGIKYKTANTSVSHGDDYVLEFSVLPEYGDSIKKVKVSIDGKEYTPNIKDLDCTYTIRNIQKNVVVSITGVTKNIQTKYTVILPDVDGIKLLPKSGKHDCNKGANFDFAFTFEPGYYAKNLKVEANGYPLSPNPLGVYSVINVLSDVHISITGIIKTNSSTGTEDIESTTKVYSVENTLYIEVEAKTQLMIYNMGGQILLKREISDGTTSFSLPEGIYIVSLNDQSYKIRIGK